MTRAEEPGRAQRDPRWEVEPEEPEETRPRGTMLKIVAAAVAVALSFSLFLAHATRSA